MPLTTLPTCGMNLNGYAYFGVQIPFIDVSTMGAWNPWTLAGGFGSGSITLNTGGHPIALGSGSTARKLIFTHNGAHYPTGLYRFQFPSSGVTARVLIDGSDEPTIYSSGTGVKTYNITSTNNLGLVIEIQSTSGTPAVVSLYAPFSGVNTSIPVTGIFRPGLVNMHDNLGIVRCMDWNYTNNNPISGWNQRTTLNHSNWVNSGIPYERQIDFCNTIGADYWCCVPHQATDDYVTQLATLINTRLNTGSKVWIEYSNEVWNWIFDQASYADSVLKPRYGVSNWLQAYGRRAAEVIRIVKNTISNDSRVVGVIAGQQVSVGVASTALAYSKVSGVQQADVVSCGAYYRCDEDALYADYLTSTVDLDEIFDTELPTAIIGVKDNLEEHYDLSRQYGLKGVVVYEGGQHILARNTTQANNTGFVELLHTINRDPRMEDITFQHLTAVFDAGVKTHMQFTDLRVSDKNGYWGLMENYEDFSAPKKLGFDAFVQSFTGSLPVDPANPVGLVGFWKLDETSGTTATATIGVDGTYNRNATNTTYSASSPGTAIVRGQDFDVATSGHVLLTGIPSIANASPFTFSVWVRFDSTLGYIWGNSTLDYMYLYKQSNTVLVPRVSNYNPDITVPNLGTSAWKHIAITRSDANLFKLFIDGSLIHSETGVGVFTIDTIARSVSQYGDCKVAWAKVYNTDESANIIDLYAEKDLPIITSNAGGSAASILVDEDTTDVTTVIGTNNGATVSYTIAGGADAAAFNLDPNTGVLTFIDAPDYENPHDADLNNQYVVQVAVLGPGGQDTQTITVIIPEPSITNMAHRTTGDGPCFIHFSAIDRNRTIRGSSNITGVTFGDVRNLTAEGVGTVTYTSSGQTIKYAAPGDTAGTPLVLTTNLQSVKLYSANGIDWIYIDVTYASLPINNQSDDILIITTRNTEIPQPTAVLDPGDPDYASQTYYWDFDDPYAINYTLTNNRNSNTCWGAPQSAHLYTEPGVYHPKLYVWDIDGNITTYTETITITRQEDTATIYYVDATSGNNGNVGTNPALPLQTFAAALAKVTSDNIIIKFKRGETFTVSSGITINQNNITLTSYYNIDGSDDITKNKPVFNVSITSGTWIQAGSGITDLKICHLSSTGPGSGSTIAIGPGGTNPTQNVTIYDCYITAFHSGIIIGGTHANWGSAIYLAIIACDLYDLGFGAGSVGIYVDMHNSAILGTKILDVTGGEHCARIWGFNNSVIADSLFSRPATIRAALTLRGIVYGTVNATTTLRFTSNCYMAVLRSEFYVDLSGTVGLSANPQNNTSDERIEHIIFDSNKSTTPNNIGSSYQSLGRDFCYRNCISNSVAPGWTFTSAGARAAPRMEWMRIFNCTTITYASGSSTDMVSIVGITGSTNNDTINTNIKNNIWIKAGSTTQTRLWGDSFCDLSTINSDYNLLEIGGAAQIVSVYTLDTGSTVTRTLAQNQSSLSKELNSIHGLVSFTNSGAGDYTLQASSSGIGLGDDSLLPWVRFDASGNYRTSNISAGAFEYNYSIWTPPVDPDDVLPGISDSVFKINANLSIPLSSIITYANRFVQSFNSQNSIDISLIDDRYTPRFHHHVPPTTGDRYNE